MHNKWKYIDGSYFLGLVMILRINIGHDIEYGDIARIIFGLPSRRKQKEIIYSKFKCVDFQIGKNENDPLKIINKYWNKIEIALQKDKKFYQRYLKYRYWTNANI